MNIPKIILISYFPFAQSLSGDFMLFFIYLINFILFLM